MSGYALTRLLQLTSPVLPVGAYSYSQGLEWASEVGIVRDEPTALAWIADVLRDNVALFEAPLLASVIEASRSADWTRVHALNELFIASRESSELRNETLQMGHSLRVLLEALPGEPGRCVAALHALDTPSFVVAWGMIAADWGVPTRESVVAYLWAWAENQVMAAVKAVPLGQAAGQRLLLALGESVETLAEQALCLPEPAWRNFSPGFAIASCRHETQYTRLFRS